MSEYKLMGGAVLGKELGRIWEDMADRGSTVVKVLCYKS